MISNLAFKTIRRGRSPKRTLSTSGRRESISTPSTQVCTPIRLRTVTLLKSVLLLITFPRIITNLITYPTTTSKRSAVNSIDEYAFKFGLTSENEYARQHTQRGEHDTSFGQETYEYKRGEIGQAEEDAVAALKRKRANTLHRKHNRSRSSTKRK